MEHVLIFFQILGLMTGTWATFYAYQMYKRDRRPFIQAFIYFIILWNVIILAGLTSRYLYTNIIDYTLPDKHPLSIYLATPIHFLMRIGMAYSFLRTIMALQERSMPRTLKVILLGIITVFVFGFGIGIAFWIQSHSIQYIAITLMIYHGAIYFTLYGSLIELLMRQRLKNGNEKRRAIKAFAYFYLVGLSLLIISSLLPMPMKIFSWTSVLLLMNLCPLIWFKTFYPHFISRNFEHATEKASLYSLYQKHSISKREQEIVGLLIQGKSYKEISDSLYISFNTVKNHIYNLYKKLGVKNRAQLMHIILNSKE